VLVVARGVVVDVLVAALTVATAGVGEAVVADVEAVVGTMLMLTDDVDGGDMTASPMDGSDPGI
jgi:hypothetical protein